MTERDRRDERRALVVATLSFVILVIVGAIGYRGFIEGDAANHYLIARFSVDRPINFVGVWGRPLCTLLYALPAQLGRHGDVPNVLAGVLATRALSLALALLIAFVTYRLAKHHTPLRWPALAVAFVFAQPIFYVHAFSEMTEIPFAVVLAGAFWAYARRKWLVMAAVAGLLPLGRPEGFGMILLAAAALVWHRRAVWLVVLAGPFLVWNYAGWALTHPAVGPHPTPWYLWVKANWPYSATSPYGRGAVWDLPSRLPCVVGLLVFPLTVVGLVRGLRRHPWARGARAEADELHVGFWVAALPLLTLVGHTILWCGGWMASNGSARYLVVCTPFWALLTADGWEFVWQRYRLRASHATAVACSILPLLITFTGISYPNMPLGPVKADRLSQRIAEWWHANPDVRRRYPRIISSLPTLSYDLDIDLSLPAYAAEPGKTGIRKRTPGTILIWDPVLGTTNADRNLCLSREEIEAAGWVHVLHVNNEDLGSTDRAEVYLSPVDIDGKATQVAAAAPAP